MTTPVEKKPSWWAIFLGRSPPMPPIPPGGWTPESVREYWRQRIVTSPQDAPLSHAALAELLRTRDTFQNWFIWRKRPGSLEPLAPEQTFIQRTHAIPALCFFVALGITYALFTLFSWMRGFYPLIFFSEDTLCVAGGSIFTRRPFRCDNAVRAVDFALMSSLVCLGIMWLVFLKNGGKALILHSQNTKKYIDNGGIGSIIIAAVLMFLGLSWAIKFYVLDQDLLPHILFVGLPCLVSVITLLLHGIWLALRAACAMIFFYMTGQFPSWLEDLSL
jgi:hypothetical protein